MKIKIVPAGKQQAKQQTAPEFSSDYLRKKKYCSEWMKKEEGISHTNSDMPPSLYEPSVDLSQSLLDVTSMSRNEACKNNQNFPQQGRGTQTKSGLDNVMFV